MLSKLFTTARTLLDRSSQAQGQELQQKDSTSEPVDNMVTTRLQGAQNASDDRDAKRTSSSRKRQILSSDYGDLGSADDGEADVPANKKQKVLPLRAKDDEVPKRNTRPVVEIPVNRISLEHSSNIMAGPKNSRKHSPTPLVPRDAERSTSNESKMEIPNSDSEGENSHLETAVTKLNNSKDTEKFSGEDVVKPTSTNTSKAVPSASKARHKRFDSEEPEVMVVSNTVAKSDSEDESSDDDAPEVVGAQEALEQAKMKEREAAKAVEERESAIRRKRKERDAILKQQASSKRKREGELQRKKAAPLDISPSRARGAVDEEHNKQTATIAESASPMKLAPGSSLPEFLPEEYLEDSESEDDMAVEPVNPAKRAKKTKFVELVEKRPKDIRLGSTTYRVAEVRSTKLAPKSSFNARAMKESWLQGRGNASRKSFSSGFFKSR